MSLLNVDYKILSKILANRFKKVIHLIVPGFKKCGVPDRQINDIILLIDSTMKYIEESEGKALIICIDQEKAFDRVNHKYMFEVLKKMGIKSLFLKFVTACYNNITSQLLINEKLTRNIKVERSVRQGCPLAMLLFILISVPLSNKIDKH